MLTKQKMNGILWADPEDPNFGDVSASPYLQPIQPVETYGKTALPTATYDRRLLPEYGGDI